MRYKSKTVDKWMFTAASERVQRDYSDVVRGRQNALGGCSTRQVCFNRRGRDESVRFIDRDAIAQVWRSNGVRRKGNNNNGRIIRTARNVIIKRGFCALCGRRCTDINFPGQNVRARSIIPHKSDNNTCPEPPGETNWRAAAARVFLPQPSHMTFGTTLPPGVVGRMRTVIAGLCGHWNNKKTFVRSGLARPRLR